MKTKNRRRRRRQTEYWVYAKANQMKEHRFNDDVALCKAQSKTEAFNKFKRLYGNADYDSIFRLSDCIPWSDVIILTDY